MSSVNKAELDDYEDAMEKLLTELREYESATMTLRQAAQSLDRIHKLNSNAGKSLNALVADAAQILSSIQSLDLDQLVAESTERYSAHQSSLEQLDRAVQDAVREQHSLGLEMLQHTTASQKELASYSSQVQDTFVATGQREEAIHSRLQTFATKTESTFNEFETQITMLRTLMFVTISLIVTVGVLILIR